MFDVCHLVTAKEIILVVTCLVAKKFFRYKSQCEPAFRERRQRNLTKLVASCSIVQFLTMLQISPKCNLVKLLRKR